MLNLFRRRPRRHDVIRAEELFHVPPYVTAHVTETGLVLLHADKGLLFKANHIGARIWKGIAQGQPVQQVAAELSREVNMPVSRLLDDARNFLDVLLQQGLLYREAQS
jgi:hypothetical protein